MKKYRVDTQYWKSKEFTNLNEAIKKFEYTKDQELGSGVDQHSQVKLVCSNDDFKVYDVLKQANVKKDVQKDDPQSCRLV